MNSIFADLITADKMAGYMDDLLIYSANLIQLCKVTHEVLARLEQYNLYLKPEKCKFKKQKMEYLGIIITPGEVCMDPGKVSAVCDWPTPTMLREVRAFIAFANSYWRFIQDFASIAHPPHDLTKKDMPWQWHAE